MSALVKRLREVSGHMVGDEFVACREAADRLEALEALLREAREALDDLPGSPGAGRLQDRIDAALTSSSPSAASPSPTSDAVLPR